MTEQVPEWMQAYGERLRREMLEDQARFLSALAAAFKEVDKFYGDNPPERTTMDA